MQADARVEMRIHRLKRRVARLERGLELMKRWDERNYRLLRPFILEILDEDPDATDEEIVDALVEKIDQLLCFQGIAEIITDIGIRVAGEVGLWVHQNKERLITQRTKRLRKRIAQLEKQLAKRTGKPARARGTMGERTLQDTHAIFVALGMSEAFLEHAKPTKGKPGKTRARRAAQA
jgi:hypothetical protein